MIPNSRKKLTDQQILNKFNHINSDIEKKILVQNLSRVNKIKYQVNVVK